MVNKQIKEMVSLSCPHYDDGNCTCNAHQFGVRKCDGNCSYGRSAVVLYYSGYRKQSEGKWLFKQTCYGADECNCSLCGQLMTTAKGVRMHFCPNCGAKMKECVYFESCYDIDELAQRYDGKPITIKGESRYISADCGKDLKGGDE